MHSSSSYKGGVSRGAASEINENKSSSNSGLLTMRGGVSSYASRGDSRDSNSSRNSGSSSRKMSELFEDNEMQNIIDGIVDEKFILNLTGYSTVEEVNHLKMKINTNTQSIYVNSSSLPNLATLNLDGSVIHSIRDLGVGFRNLFALSINECGLADLDGVGVLIGLESLSICNNAISDLSPLAMHENLKKLNATGNKLNDLSFADALSSCPKLYSINIANNPISTSNVPNLIVIIGSIVTSLEQIDGIKVNKIAASKVTYSMVLETTDALKIANEEESKKESDRLRLSSGGSVNSLNPDHSQLRAGSSGSAAGNSGGSAFPNIIPDTGSELTHGSNIVFAGNVASAMRRRKTDKQQDIDNAKNNNSSSFDGARSSFDGSLNLSLGKISPRDSVENDNLGALHVLDACVRGDYDKQIDPAGGGGNGVTSHFEGDITKKFQQKSNVNISVEEIFDEDDNRTSSMNRSSQVVRSSKEGKLSNGNVGATATTNNNYNSSNKTQSSLLTYTGESRKLLSSKSEAVLADKSNAVISKATDKSGSSKPSTSTTSTSNNSKSKSSASDTASYNEPKKIGSGRSAFNPFNALLVEEKVNNNHNDEDEDDDDTDTDILDIRRQRDMYESGATSALKTGQSPLSSADSTPRPLSSRGGSRPNYRNNNGDSDGSDSMDDMVKYYKNSRQRGAKKSIVHLDIVKRNMNESLQQVDIEIARAQGENIIDIYDASDLSPSKDNKDDDSKKEKLRKKKYNSTDPAEIIVNGDDSADSDDNNNFSISHSSRFRLMSASGRRSSSGNNNISNNNNNNNNNGCGSSSSSSGSKNTSNQGNKRGGLLTYGGNGQCYDGDEKTDQNSSGSPSTNEVFNNNLAQNTKLFMKHLEDDDIDNGESSSNNRSSSLRKAGRVLGFDLKDGLAAIDQWVGPLGDANKSNSTQNKGKPQIALSNSSKTLNKASGIVIKALDDDDDDDDGSDENDTMFLKRGDIMTMFSKNAPPSSPKSPVVEVSKNLNNNGISSSNSKSKSKSSNKSSNSSSSSSSSNSSGMNGGNSISTTIGSGNGLNAVNYIKHTSINTSNTNNNTNNTSISSSSSSNSNNINNGSSSSSSSSAKVLLTKNVHSPLKSRSLKEQSKVDSNQNNSESFSLPLVTVGGTEGSPSSALSMSDRDIIELLRCPPKSVPIMKTKSSFQAFFKGFSYEKMKSLLENAYSTLPSETEKNEKVTKRLELLKEVLF